MPVERDPVEKPFVAYGGGPASINFVTNHGRWGRVTFEKLDSIRISRGEYEPYPSDWKPGDELYWVSVVASSPWLRERYEYEKQHYGEQYEFTGDVEEMLRDFSHYLFSFHDQFVEVVCAGIWFEVSEEFLGNSDPSADHPLLDLPPSESPDRFEAHGITCQVRRNTRPLDHVLEEAKLCSQKLLQFAAELDGSASVSWTLTVRVHDGVMRTHLKDYFGHVKQSYDGIPALEDVRPHVEEWLQEVHERRKQMGKA